MIALLELAALGLDDLTSMVVFAGGATIEVWLSDPGHPEVRVTEDVAVIVEVATQVEYHKFGGQLRQRGFIEAADSQIICRWKHPKLGLVLDAMPVNPDILGFGNRWFHAAMANAEPYDLPSGNTIRVASPVQVLAMKLAAFIDRGTMDFYASRDFFYIVALIDGRAELVDEVVLADPELRDYLSSTLLEIAGHPRFTDGIHGQLLPDRASQARADTIVIPRIHQLMHSRE